MYVCIYSMRVKSRQLVCVWVCASLWVKERLLALLIIHRWVFTIEKGELERKWWSPCAVDERSPEVTLFTDIHLQLYSRLKGKKKKDDSAFAYFLAIFMSDWLYFCIRLSHLLLNVSTSELVCLCVCVRLTGSGDLLFVRLHTGVKPCQAPGEQPQQYSDLSHFLRTHARKHAVLSVARYWQGVGGSHTHLHDQVW